MVNLARLHASSTRSANGEAISWREQSSINPSVLRIRFGDEGLKLSPEISEIYEDDKVETILKALETATSLEAVRRLWVPPAS
jgi:hypothetical protein